MYPVVIGNGRCMTKDTVIKGYRVPKGVRKNSYINLSIITSKNLTILSKILNC